MNKTVQEYRQLALQAILNKLGDSSFNEHDKVIDELARKVHDLPPRPLGQQPYIGWVVGEKKPNKQYFTTSEQGIDFIKHWEGLRTNAYKCPAGVWTIGYGHTNGVKSGMMISHIQAEQLLKKDLLKFEKAVNELVTVKINQRQFDALVSFTFNCGISAFARSSLLKKINRKHFFSAASEFMRWVHAERQVLPGLVQRRQQEKEMFLS